MINNLADLQAELNAKKENLNQLVNGFTKNIENLDASDKTINRLKEIMQESINGKTPDLNEIQKIIEDADGVNNTK